MSIYDFKHGVRIPAGSCSTYSNTPKAELISASGGLDVFNYDGPVDVSCVCQLGNVEKGEIYAEIGGVRWNAPRQHLSYAAIKMLPSTPYEIPLMKQKKVVLDLPISGNNSLTTDRIQCNFIQARFHSNSAISIEQSLSLFYFEVYWD